MSYAQRTNKELSRDPYLFGVRDYIDLKETSQDSVNGDTPKWWQLALGIPFTLVVLWASIWMGAILLDGCNPPDAYAKAPISLEQNQADLLEALLQRLVLEDHQPQQASR